MALSCDFQKVAKKSFPILITGPKSLSKSVFFLAALNQANRLMNRGEKRTNSGTYSNWDKSLPPC